MIDMLLAANKHFVAVLKDNQPDLLREARTLLPGQSPENFTLAKRPGSSARHVQLRQADGFTTDSISSPLRVVHAHETGIRHVSVAGQHLKSPIDTHWYWATTMRRP